MKCQGLPSNARIRIKAIYDHCIHAVTIGSDTEETVLIPRMRFKFRTKYGNSFKMTRTQFPLRLAYSMTYNKSQSQTLQRVLLDVTSQPFCHGHLYVALSRVRSFKDICMYVKENQLHVKPLSSEFMPVVTNVLYTRVLAHIS